MLLVRLIAYWYASQQFCVKWDHATSGYFTTCNGVRQGGIMSPRLFSMYLDKLSYLLSSSNVGCFIDGVCMNHYFYADDMCILAPSASGLQKLVDICAEYGIEHDILYHTVKTKCVTFLPKRYKLHVPSVSLNNVVLDYVDKIKYLGVTLSSSLTDDLDITRQLRCLYGGANMLLLKFYRCSKSVKQLLIKSYC